MIILVSRWFFLKCILTHIAFEKNNAEDYGTLVPHRDGTSSVYIKDPSNNAVEILKKS